MSADTPWTLVPRLNYVTFETTGNVAATVLSQGFVTFQ